MKRAQIVAQTMLGTSFLALSQRREAPSAPATASKLRLRVVTLKTDLPAVSNPPASSESAGYIKITVSGDHMEGIK